VIGTQDYREVMTGQKTLTAEITIEYDGPSAHYKESTKGQYDPLLNMFMVLGSTSTTNK